jgi:hypothetical protein
MAWHAWPHWVGAEIVGFICMKCNGGFLLGDPDSKHWPKAQNWLTKIEEENDDN